MSTKQVSQNIAAKLRSQNQHSDRPNKDEVGIELLTLVEELEGREQIREDQEVQLLKRLRELESQMQVHNIADVFCGFVFTKRILAGVKRNS
eukprot:3507893-Rhodomonas_salina.1